MSAIRLIMRTVFIPFFLMFAWLLLLPTTAVQAQVSFTDTGFFTETIATLPAYTPVGVAFAPDGRLFIWQKNGIVRILKNGQLLPNPFLDISAKVNHYQDRGLLGLALDPNFAVNGYVYLGYVLENGGDTNSTQDRPEQFTRVTADPTNPDVALANSEVVILGGIPEDSPSHAIGMIRFAPDGKMFVSVGDGAGFSNVDANALRAQDLTSLNGKILRINPDGSAPTDNPFYEPANPISNKSKVWAYGLRNPFRFALHPVTGSPLDGTPYIGNVGWNTWEEQVRGRGVNFGWPCYEGGYPQPDYQAQFAQCQQLSADSVTQPLYVYDHTVGSTAIGGAFYSGILYPSAYRGNYFFMDYTAKWIKRMVFDANDNVLNILPFAANVNGPVDLEMGPDGLLYYVAFNAGEIGRIHWGTGPQPPMANATATPTSGYSPLTVNFSSVGSADPQGEALTYFWDFGDGTSSTAANPTHTYVQGGVRTFTATLTVTNTANLSATATVNVTVGSKPPVAAILSPATGTKVNIGDTVTFQGTATDPDEGTLPGSDLSWTVIIHHNSHIHPFITATGSSGSFTVIDHGAGNYSFEIILTATDSSGLTNTTSVTLPVNNIEAPFAELDFTYSSRDEMELAGWDFLAKTAGGATRNTEQSGALAVDYNQTVHPNVLRAPIGQGEIWQALNNSQNTLFRDLPSDWVSIRLKLAAFNPVANYQQVGLLAYQDDDNYVNVNRPFEGALGGQTIELFQEIGQVPNYSNRQPLVNTGNLILRLDRDAGTDTYTGYYSTDGELSWVLIGSTVAVLNNARLGIQVGSNQAGTLPVADLEWAQVLRPAPGPVVSGVSPSSGGQGQTLTNVVISGSNFQNGATCNFGSGISVTSCTFTSITQLTANITVAANAVVGARTVSVTNPDGQSGSLASGFNVTTTTGPAPAPGVSGVSPGSGVQGQTLSNVVINGSNFVSGTTCSFGSGITVNACTFNSTTQLTADITIGVSATIGARTVSVTNPDAQSGSLTNAFSVTAPIGVPAQQFDLTYASSAALKADGWDFLAKTAAGVMRDTEQTGALAVDYDQTAHPGVLRIPLGKGELWQALNNSQNTLFHDLPSDWVSIRLKIAAFNPVANYQQVGLLAYQDDDNYINVNRPFVDTQGGQTIEMFRESNQVTNYSNRQPLANTGNVILRLDRNATTNIYTGYYSGDGGASWTALGSATMALVNPRLGIQAGSNQTATALAADLAWVEIVRPAPAPVVSGVSPSSGEQGQTLTNVVISGSNFQSGAVCSFGSGVTMNSCTFTSATQLIANVTIAANAATGGRTVSVTNPDTQSASLANAFVINQHISLTYPTSIALKADGWDFVARTVSGGMRDTEQTGALAVDYDQTTHPGVIRIPLGNGEIWQALNDSQNTLFHDLPSDWTSLRLMIAAFNPVANYQQVGLLAYQDDDNYVNVDRPFVDTQGGQTIELFRESNQIPSYSNRQPLANTGNLILRLDRNAATNVYAGYYSVDGGASWVAIGSTTIVLVSPCLGIQVGSNQEPTTLAADLAWVEILR